MTILAIETSCDESSIAILDDDKQLLSHLVRSQIETHQHYGGVVPEMASRMHTEALPFLIQQSLDEAQLKLDQIDAFAVTKGPGLEGALLVGISAAKTLAYAQQKPVIGVNHLQGHLYAHFLKQDIPFPFVFLLISGGHTLLALVKDHFDIELLGQTRDDAVGEVFDKVARFIEIGYPGGPKIEEHALQGEPTYKFPMPLNDGSVEFSFSGLKTAVIQWIGKNPGYSLENLCASFQKTVGDILIKKTLIACEKNGVKRIAIGGGVAANRYLSKRFLDDKPDDIDLHLIDRQFCTDNAAMIACCAHYQLKQARHLADFSVCPQLSLCN